ncbi:hypothetical protein [Clostridium oceanicum]|uniref:Chromosome partition protein Smc n=1 Tax=Clostridium oceanicum TaxID=1543 RepID=A0ABP3UNA8_9CLOT
MYPNNIDVFIEKLNKLDNNTYVIEEVVNVTDGIFKGYLKHDNVSKSSVRVYTAPKLTGDKIDNFILSTPSKTPWKLEIKIFSDVSPVYVTYETQGDTVEAEDINKVQESIVNTQTALNSEINRATTSENNIRDNLNEEVNRAKNNEENLNNQINTTNSNLNKEITRSIDSENNINDELNSEINRAKNRENVIESDLNNYKQSNDSKIQKLKEKDVDLDNVKSDKTYVDTELNKRYLKNQVFTKEEVLEKITNVIGTAPQALDTLQEIAESLNNDEDFAGTMTSQLSKKVDKVQGKSLSDENFTNVEKVKLAGIENNANRYVHPQNHLATVILQDESHRFVSDSEKRVWNNKVNKSGDTITGPLNIIGTAADRPLIVRGISGCESLSETPSELYLNYDSDLPIHFGTSIIVDPKTKTIGATSDNTVKLNNKSHDYYLDYNNFTNKPDVYTKNQSNQLLDQKSNNNHTHDDRYYTESECNNKFVTKGQLGDAGYGDMAKLVYDKNNNGKVDVSENADKVGGKSPEDFLYKTGNNYLAFGSTGQSVSNKWYQVMSWKVDGQYNNFQTRIFLTQRGNMNHTGEINIRGEYGTNSWSSYDVKLEGYNLDSKETFLLIMDNSKKTASLYYKKAYDWDLTVGIIAINYLSGAAFSYDNKATNKTTTPTGDISLLAKKYSTTWNYLKGV